MSIRWTVRDHRLTIPGPTSDKEIGQAKNLLRKVSKGFDAIYRNRGL